MNQQNKFDEMHILCYHNNKNNEIIRLNKAVQEEDQQWLSKVMHEKDRQDRQWLNEAMHEENQ